MITLKKLQEKKQNSEKIVMLTAYDYPMARILEKVGMDMILVGDSGGMVKLGYNSTIPVTMEEMIIFTKAVRKGAPDTFIIADMPYMSYQTSRKEAIKNAGRLVKEGGADAVKLEGGINMIDKITAIINAGIAVQGHIGLTPQSITLMNGFVSQGKTVETACALLDDAQALEKAGIFSLILEAVPVKIAKYITENIKIPTIGTGSGHFCDGQNLISSDVIGFFDKFIPKFAKQYVNINEIILEALIKYKKEVTDQQFPEIQHTYPLKSDQYIDDLIKTYNWNDK
ncbi:3-methyl-2-oxobutanoate hydroxymethyltransferase [Phascolarctobacterium sp.]